MPLSKWPLLRWARWVSAVCVVAQSSWAFTLETAFSSGCHERITLEALQRAGWPAHLAEPDATAADVDLARNLPFRVPPLAGRWTISLLLGVRSNDLHGYAPTDFQEFAAAQLGEDAQEEHCLRTAADDDVEGDHQATQRCLQFVVDRAQHAIGSASNIDPNDTESVRVALRYQSTDVEVSRFAYRAGQALHALQDSYTHTLREPTTDAIIHVFNYVDPAIRADYSVGRDGFGHVSKFDDCDNSSPLEQERTERAIAASAAFLAALAGPLEGEPRLEQTRALASSLVSYQPGCNPDNAWCDAAGAEAAFRQSCSSVGSAPVWLLVSLGVLLMRRRRQLQAALAAPALIVLIASSTAQALPLSVSAGAAASVDRTALAANVGMRVGLSEKWSVGVDAEFNPWFDLLSANSSLGVFNAYASGSYRWFNTGIVSLHSTLKAGASVLLFNAVGVPAGSTGIFLGASLLGVSLDLGSGFFLLIDPVEVAVAVPSLKGVPLIARQYRLGIGIEHRF